MNIIDKIRALRAKAEDSASTEAEAEAFATKVHQLMEKHYITEEQLNIKKADHIRHQFKMKYACGWRRQLASAVGRFIGVAFSWLPNSEHAIYTGRPMLVEAAEEMYHHLERQCVLIPRSIHFTQKEQRRASKGVALGLCERLYKIMDSLPKSKFPVVQEFKEAKKAQGDIKTTTLDDTIDSPEAYAGYKSADRVEIQKQTP